MSKFQSTVSIVAALASICGATAAGWKLADMSSSPSSTHLEQKIQLLEQKLEMVSGQQSVQEVKLKIEPEVKNGDVVLSVEPPSLPPVPVEEVAQDALTAP